MRALNRPASIVITGASAGLGAALAKIYAGPGIRLHLIGRSESRLNSIADQCRDAGATVEILVTDIADHARINSAFTDWGNAVPIDLVVVNAGVFDGHGPDGRMETVADIEGQILVNLNGAIATINAALPLMRARKAGTIAIIGSLAALQPLADAPGYSASKAGIMAYGEALREYLLPENIRVSLVYPGHIDTAQVRDHVGALPLLRSPEAAAKLIRSRLDRGHTVITFPWQLRWLIALGRMVPWRVRAMFGKDFRFHVDKK